jgi:L-glutamine:2-deoxy-scyllo-inosose/3-amino-2,3-dideoxy-scyllo-inosose aminotransferase
MKSIRSSSSRLAAFGGKPVFSSIPQIPWPPIDTATERELVRIYRGHSWSFNGPVEQAFCKEFARSHTAKHAVFMVNGTVTLEGALYVLGVGPGDEVIVPGLTWMATALAVVYVGAKPVFVDIEPDTLCLDPEKVKQAITPRTKAIIPVHLYGGMADMDRIMAIARKHGLKVVEDCAHAHGGIWGNRGVGSIGDVGSFSFQQSKTVASGEGGACLTNDAKLADMLYRFKHIGYKSGAAQGKASMGPPPGFICHNYRCTEFQAAILRGQIRNLKAMSRRRDQTSLWFRKQLAQVPGVTAQARGRRANPQGYYGQMVLVNPAYFGNASLPQIQHAMRKEGLTVTSGAYGSVYRHILWNAPSSAYRIHGGYRDAKGPACEITEDVCQRRAIFFMHTFLDWPRKELAKVIDVFAKLQENADDLRKIKI